MRGNTILHLKIAVSAIILAGLFYLVDWKQASTAIKNAHYGWVIAVLVLATGVLLLDGLRTSWALISDNFQLSDHLRIAFEGASVAQLGVGPAAGDLYRTARYTAGSETLVRSVTHILALRVAGLMAVGLVAFVIAIWLMVSRGLFVEALEEITWPVFILIVLVPALAFLFLFLLNTSRNARVERGRAALAKAARAMSFRIWLVSLLMVLIRGLAFASALFALGVFLPLTIPIFASTIAALTTLFPFALGGLGIREGTLAGIIVLFETPFSSAFSAAILLRLATVIAAITGLFITSFVTGKKTDFPDTGSGEKP